MDEAAQAADAPRSKLMGAPDRAWHLRAWSGVRFGGWMRELARNHFAISPIRLAMAVSITTMSLFNSSMGLLQRGVFGRRIERTELVEDPVFVLGHWRSGTTLLHELLACDPRHGFADTYSCFAPNHFLLTERFLKPLIGFFLPRNRPMDNMAVSWNNPQEDEWALCCLGARSPYFLMLFPNRPLTGPNYADLRDVPPADLDRWKQTLSWFLKALTLRDGKRIVLKSPYHTCRVRTLQSMFPRARFVHIVRNPYEVFASTMHTWHRMYRYQGLQIPRFKGLEEHVLTTFTRMYEAFEEDVKSISPGRFCELRYEDLVADPRTVMENVYRQLDLGDFASVRDRIEQRMAGTTGYQTNRYVLPEREQRLVAQRWGDFFVKYGYHGSAESGS